MLSVTLEGKPFARGYQHGQRFAAEIREAIRTYCPDRWLSDPEVQTLERRLLESLASEAPELVVEMAGISEGSGVPWAQITLLNLVLASNNLECDSVARTFKLACSAIGFADSDVGPLVAKNCDETLKAAPFYLFQTVCPAGGMAYMCISWVGTVWAEAGLNDAGLAVAQTAGPSVPDQDGHGVVCNIAPRPVLERCRTTYEAMALFERMDVAGWGMGAVIADGDGTVVAVEKTYDRQAVRLAHGGVAYCTNHFEEPIMEGTVPFAQEGIIPNSQTRYRTLGRLFGEQGWPRTLEGMMGALGYHDAEGFVCQHGQIGSHSNYSFIAMGATQCAPKPGPAQEPTQVPVSQPTVSVTTQARPTTAPAEKVTLHVVLSTYWKEEWWKTLITKFEATHPNIKIDYWLGSDWTEYIQTKMAAGETPDVFWLLRYEWIDNGLVMDLTDALRTPPYGQTSGTWMDTFYAHPGPIKYKGRYYTLPWDLYTDGYIWYNVDLFKEHGKKPPETWNDFLALCEYFKGKGIAPLAQSNDPLYINQWWRLLAQRIAGLDKIRATGSAQRQEGNAWTDPEFLRAAQMAQELANKGYFLAGYEGMNYQTAQMEFIQGHAAMMLIGNWLAGEMRDSWPADFHADYVRFPAVPGGKGDPTVQIAGTSDMCLYAKTKHPAEVIEFAKWMTSLEAVTQMAADSGLLYATKGSTPPEKMTEFDKKAIKYMEEAHDTFDMGSRSAVRVSW